MGGSGSKSQKPRLKNFKFPPIDGHKYEYDLVVIGGGSGGISAAKEAQKLGRKVAICDFVSPTPFGTTWGLGGTCVNVGCIPKKLMHIAGLTGSVIGASGAYGYTLMPHPSEEEAIRQKLMAAFDWPTFVENIQTYIKSLNWTAKVGLKDKQIDYMNAYAEFMGPHTLQLRFKNNEIKTISGNVFLLANGCRPRYLDVPGGRFSDALCITSDDLFSMISPPGKTLVIGASFVALECSGILNSLGYNVTLLVRSKILRSCDTEIAAKVTAELKFLGVKIYLGYEPVEIKKVEGTGKLWIKFKDATTTKEDEFDTIMLAVGRYSPTENMGLEVVRVKVKAGTGRIIVNENDQTSITHIFAVGDVADTRPEFSPLAVHAGRYVAKRLFEKGFKEFTDYECFPQTIYTPIEYGWIGLSEETANEQYGADHLEIYQSNFSPLEEDLPHQLPKGTCFMKLICVNKSRSLNTLKWKREGELVVGLHYYGPNAGEVVQGYALGFRLKAMKSDFDSIIGIHPTCSERFTTLHINKRNAEEGELYSC